jgi:hypothetical protein
LISGLLLGKRVLETFRDEKCFCDAMFGSRYIYITDTGDQELLAH